MPLIGKTKKLDYITYLFSFFKIFCSDQNEMGITEIARALGSSTSKVFRVVHTLNSLGYLRKNPVTKKYRLGLKLWELGCAAVDGFELREVARPFLEDLMVKSQESVYLAVLDGCEVVYIDRVESAQPIRAGRKIGGRVPAFLAATGKAILAFEQANVVQYVISGWRKDNRAAFSSEVTKFHKDLLKIRSRGFSVNLGKYNREIGGVGAPIFNHSNKVVAAIAITGPIAHFKEVNLERFCQLVKSTSEEISKALGADLNKVRSKPEA